MAASLNRWLFESCAYTSSHRCRCCVHSVEEGQPWQVLISQTVFAPIKAPKLLATVDLQPKLLAWINSKALDAATRKSRAGKEGAELARMHLAMGQFGVPMNPGAWDGYAAERAEVRAAE